jgi:hypothetical protein
MCKVVIRIFGSLANQLFAITCRKAAAAERLEPFSRIRRNLLRRWNARRPFEQYRYIQQQGTDFDSRLLTLRPSSTLYLEGYWQSEGYFKDDEPQIRESLPFILPKDDVNHQMAIRIMGYWGNLPLH